MTKYEKIIKDFKSKDYEVIESSAFETVGYAEPTEEFWITIIIEKNKKRKLEMIYSFKNNKNVIDEVQMWKTKFIMTEETEKIF